MPNLRQMWPNPRNVCWKPYELVLEKPMPDSVTERMIVAIVMVGTNTIINALTSSRGKS